ncbi:MAG: FAD-dependent oxidoreductase [Candidatus Giovannonibacteria bacterium]|nr:MAG: FAD-dependent oxidoreductase [Candidatus Giovannonibacteria bacterium]
MIHDVVIIGGGFGGVKIAKILADEKNLRVTLVDKSRYHTFYPNLYEVATAHLPEVFGHLPIDFVDLKSSVIYPLEDIFLDDLNVSVLEDEFLGADFKKHFVNLKRTGKLRYDFLVLAMGSETNYFGIPGMTEKALPLKNFFDALALRNAIDELFFRAPKNHLIKIVIGGGGFTGCELAGELMGYMDKLSQIHGRPRYYAECLIVEAAEALLGSASPWVQKKAKARLQKLGVKFMFKSAIKEIGQKEIILGGGPPAGEACPKVPYDLLVWTAGVKASESVKALEGVKFEKASCVAVDKNLRIAPYENVFGVGDITYCVDEATGKSLPMTASVALREAKCVAENIKRTAARKTLLHYRVNHPGFIIPLGGKYALLELYGVRFSGFLPWFLKEFIALRYWAGLLGWQRAYGLWRKGLEIHSRND